MKTIIRWTIGDVSDQGLECLNLSIKNMTDFYGYNDFYYFICHNNISKKKLNSIGNSKINLLDQEKFTESLPIAPSKEYGVSWKLYPPRIDVERNEIFMDNDIVFHKKIILDEFKDYFLISEAINRSYGFFDNKVISKRNMNSGFFKLLPGYDFAKKLSNTILEFDFNWTSYFDEQGLVSYIISKENHLVVGLDKLTITHNNFDNFIGEYGTHFIGINFMGGGINPYWNRYKQIFDDSIIDFENLKLLLNSEEWPRAVSTAQIADENLEKEKKERAEGIVDIMLSYSLENKKFLDLGCGEGHIAKHISDRAEVSVGYDLDNSKSKFKWESKENKMLLTTNFEKVKSEGPYDIILIYDVLDHVEEETMKSLLEKAKSVLTEEGRIYLRCHPWSGRHGGHLYKINKAFVHLVFTNEELKKMNIDQGFNRKIIAPIETYNNAIDEAGLSRIEEEVDFQEPEPFFSVNKIIWKRILKAFKNELEWEKDNIIFQMSHSFVDYVLVKKIV